MHKAQLKYLSLKRSNLLLFFLKYVESSVYNYLFYFYDLVYAD